MNNLAIIPARSGSKGLKDKNIKLLNGKPLMAYSIDAAIKSNIFDTVMVSTDSEHYAKIAKEFGADVPFMRSEEMSSDTASSWDTVREILHNYEAMGKTFDTVCLLQPTSPLRDLNDIIEAYKMYESKSACAVVSVCEADHSPLWMNTLPSNLSLDNFINASSAKTRQGNPTFYRINGAVYVVAVANILENKIYNNSFAYIMPRDRSVDIDTAFDFKLAELFMQTDI